MPRALAVFVAFVALVVGAAPAQARAQARAEAPTTAPPPPPPKAWIAVDADTGAVVDAGNHRQPLRVASLVKVLTALVVAEHLAPDSVVEVSERAAGMPARKMQLLAGEAWRVDHLVHSLLLVSANDAAAALAEQAAGSLEDFDDLFRATAERLGFADDPVLLDPSGLDDEFSVGGGNFMSARDLAVATRAFLARPELAAIVALPEYRFVGGDDQPHLLRNHNRMLSLYPGAIGVKTGYTRRAGHSLIAAARREGRTVVAVVVGAAQPYQSAALLLDRAFSVPPAAQGDDLERLPRVPPAVSPLGEATPVPEPVAAVAAPDERNAGADRTPYLLLVGGGTPAVAILLRRRFGRRAEPPAFRI